VGYRWIVDRVHSPSDREEITMGHEEMDLVAMGLVIMDLDLILATTHDSIQA